ncbi:MAG: tetratricopeptide repeat protein [Thermodesulfobacteriota bacterium]
MALAITTIYWPLKNHEFIKFDTPVYVSANPDIYPGLTLKGLKRAFRFSKPGEHMYYHPLALVSHMIDCEFFGLQPAGHKMMNLGFHVFNSLLLFLFLTNTTGHIFASALAAGIFALHPLQLETVAWVAERKNLLSTTFWLLTMHAYASYVRKPNGYQYALMSTCFFLGLLSKPMLVTLPFSLLLLDIWPLKRLRFSENSADGNTAKPLIGRLLDCISGNLYLLREKILLFLIAFIWLFVSIRAADQLMGTPSTFSVPMKLRITHALVAYFDYLAKFFFPVDLAIFYPYPETLPPLWQIFGATALLLIFTGIAFWNSKKAPWFAAGWLWFLGTLVPVSGITQQGLWPAMADRWMYVPMIGILIVFSGYLTMFDQKKKTAKMVGLFFVSLCFLVIMGALTRSNLRYWNNHRSLFEHAVQATGNNYFAHYSLGEELFHQNQTEEALYHLRKAEQYNPDYFYTHIAIGRVLLSLNKNKEAISFLQKALSLKVDNDATYFLLGLAYYKTGQNELALQFFQNAARIRPNHALYHNGIGMALAGAGDFQTASLHFRKALSLEPQNPTANYYIGYINNRNDIAKGSDKQ